MRTIVIRENTELPVDDELASAINKMLAEDSTLPIKIKDHTVSFADYTVGSLQVGEVNIEIKPRNPVFTLETLFEMLLFESLNNFDENYLSSGFGDNQSFGIAAITSQFYYECVKLVDFGLTGGFTSEKKYGNEITGPLVLSEYHPAYIPIRGVAYMNDLYSLNVPANQIIKSAIIKVLRSESRVSIRKQYQMLLQSFEGVDVFAGNLDVLENISEAFFSSNPHYPLVLEFAIKILRDMKMKFTHGSISWYAFLHNSNDIFEKYVRKVLTKGLNSYITKWDTPKQIAVLDDGKRKGYKSYVPDILVDYDPLTNSAKAVLDAKNKFFDIDRDDIGEILHSADMYQLTFYCDKMKTNLGGLIYPAGDDYKPINVMIDGNQDFRFVLFSINLCEKISVRHRKLCNAIKEYLLYYSK